MLTGYTATDVRQTARQHKCSLQEAKKYCMTDAMFSSLVEVEMHLEKDELKEAIRLQNDLILALITETRKLL